MTVGIMAIPIFPGGLHTAVPIYPGGLLCTHILELTYLPRRPAMRIMADLFSQATC